MADDGNEDSWLYGSGEPRPEDGESTTDAAGTASKSADDESNPATDGEAVAPQTTTENGKAEEGVEGDDNEKEPMETTTVEEEANQTIPNPADEMEEADREDGERVSGEENSESEEDDDDINVVIGDIKSGPNYNIKNRGNLLPGAAGSASAPAAGDKTGKQAAGGKFNIEEFESVGIINGVPAHEFSIDSLDEKPWRKPGADITDYFNYGFNEETWRMYCERQKKMRQNESGVGLTGLMVPVMIQSHQNPIDRSAGPGGRTLTPIANEHSKYGTMPLNRRAGPPPGRRMTGAIDVIGGNGMMPPGGGGGGGEGGRPDHRMGAGGGGPMKHENAIQVMTAERREYSRPGGMPGGGGGGGKFDMPPPGFGGPGGPPPQDMPRNMGGGGGGGGMGPGGPGGGGGPGGPSMMVDPFFEPDAFSYGYEPTQDSQWGPANNNPGWAPTGIKELTPGPPQMVPPPGSLGMPGMGMPIGVQGVPPVGPVGPPRYPPAAVNVSGGGGGEPPQQQRSDRDRSMRGERSGEVRDRDRERAERERSVVDKERRSRNEREGSRRRDRSRSRERTERERTERTRRRSRSREKERAERTEREQRSSRSDKRKSDKKRDESD